MDTADIMIIVVLPCVDNTVPVPVPVPITKQEVPLPVPTIKQASNIPVELIACGFVIISIMDNLVPLKLKLTA